MFGAENSGAERIAQSSIDRVADVAMAFPPTECFAGLTAPVRIEADVRSLEIVEGALPADLRGTWYKVGGDNRFPPYLGDDIPLNGDGMMAMFRFSDAGIDFKSRYVRTPRFEAEERAGRSLFGKYRNKYTNLPEARDIAGGTANTAMVWHGGRLLALKEDSRPFQIDPDTLATMGEWDWKGRLRSATVTAHPKFDPDSGEMLFFGYEANGEGSLDIAFCVAAANGGLTREEWFEAPFNAAVHDFAVTANYIIFPLFPIVMDVERLIAGGDRWSWDASLPTKIGVFPRSGHAEQIRWFDAPTCFSSHIFNAYERDGKIVVDFTEGRRPPFPFIRNVNGDAVNMAELTPFPTRWIIDPDAQDGAISRQLIVELPAELPRIDERRAGLPYRYGYAIALDFRSPMFCSPFGTPTFNAVAAIDMDERTYQSWSDRSLCMEEPIHVPGASKPDPEDGYVLTLGHDIPGNRSEVLIFDARQVGAGPLSRALLPFRLRFATHGTWVAANPAS